jgi:hypothetical protein
MSGPSMGRRMRQLLATICVTLALALVAIGGPDLTQWVLPLNLQL